MGQSATVTDIKSRLSGKIAERVNLTAIGNSNRTSKDIAVDLIHDSPLSYSEIAGGCKLCDQTVKNLAEEITKYPRYDTVERVYRYFNLELNLTERRLKPRFANKEKEEA